MATLYGVARPGTFRYAPTVVAVVVTKVYDYFFSHFRLFSPFE